VVRREHILELSSGNVVVEVRLDPFAMVVRASDLALVEDHETVDPSGQLVVLPLGFTPLVTGGVAFHETYLAEPDEHFYGLGEKFTAFDKRGQLVTCWNHDALGCATEQSYKNVPFVVSSRGYAVFVDTVDAVRFDMCHSSQGSWSIVVPDDELDYYLMVGDPRSCLTQYQELVGGPSLPPHWAFGAWVSSGFARDDADGVRARVEALETHDVPCDVLHLDTYWQRFGRWSDMQWDEEMFPDPPALLADVHDSGMRVSLWINPYIGVESPLFAQGAERGFFLRAADGSAWVGSLWGDYHPPVAVVDFTNPEAAAWWADLVRARIADGADVLKTDFGEAIPVDAVACDGTTGDRLHNRYALLYNDAAVAAMRSAGIERPVVWARSTWAGGQRHVAQWSGDSSSTWQDLAATLRAGLSMAMSGHSFWSHDIGGFIGDPTPELYVRWAQFGLLSPLSRFHGVTSRLPWDFGEEALALVRDAAKLRIRLHPYLYAAAWDAVATGAPIMSPMVLDHPGSPDAQAADLQYLLGRDVLVAPCYGPGGRRWVWLPPGDWLAFSGGEVRSGPGWVRADVALAEIPAYVRVGAALATIDPGRRVGERPPACEELVVVVGRRDGQPAGAQARVVVGDGRLEVVVLDWSGGRLSVDAPQECADTRVLLVGPAADQLSTAEVVVNGRTLDVAVAGALVPRHAP
jgi:alpha-D-xyloside xylohydrolase